MVRIYLLTKAHVDQATEAMLLSYTVFRDIVHAIHEKREIFTPGEYLRMKSENPA
jgi:hypothetical protein